MEKEKKQGSIWRYIGFAALTYVVISVAAGVCSVLRGMVQGEEAARVTWFVILELFLIPVLFLVAGYFVSVKYEAKRWSAWKVLVPAAVFSALLLGLWYAVLEFYVILNLPTAEGGYALDLFLRNIRVVHEYEYTVLAKTDGYRNVILPLVHFGWRIIYWMFFLWGNRRYAAKNKENRK